MAPRDERDEEVTRARDGQHVARTVSPPTSRYFGADAGRLVVPDDFDAPLSDDELSLFEA